jgi:hypothetical protein
MGEFSVAVLGLSGSIFAASAAAKLHSSRAYRSFRDGLRESRLLPRHLLFAAAALLAGAEVVVAAGLLAAVALTAAAAPVATRFAEAGLVAAAVLTMVLTAGVAVVLHHGTPARCACFGGRASRPLGSAHFVRNVGLLAAVCSGLASTLHAHGRPALIGTLLAAVTGAIAALLFTRWDDLIELFAPLSPSTGAASQPPRSGRRHH